MEIALDTTALSDFAAGSEKLGEILAPYRSLALPVTVLGEYRFGLLGSKRHARLHDWLTGLLAEAHVLETTERTTAVYARIRRQLLGAGTPMPENDVWIAASAIEHNLPLAARDKQFRLVRGLEVVSW